VERFRELLLRERLPDRDLDPERLLELERDWPELCSPEVKPELVLALEPLPWCPIGSDRASIWVTISVVALASALELRVEVDLPVFRHQASSACIAGSMPSDRRFENSVCR
jgi:hypothetical protein